MAAEFSAPRHRRIPTARLVEATARDRRILATCDVGRASGYRRPSAAGRAIDATRDRRRGTAGLVVRSTRDTGPFIGDRVREAGDKPRTQIAKNVPADASSAVTFIDNPTASAGIVHCDPGTGPRVP